jgi:hypothetical protein
MLFDRAKDLRVARVEVVTVERFMVGVLKDCWEKGSRLATLQVRPLKARPSERFVLGLPWVFVSHPCI